MSKALVIKGANFAANRVDVVTLQTVVPCESIALSLSTITFTAIGATQQLTATVLPIDTTESVIWASSDENCVTVEDGLVTCVGVGTATITATCGTQSATCAVTATVTLDMSTVGVVLHKGLTSTDLSLDPPKDYMSVYGTESGGFLNEMTFLSNVVTPSGIQCISVGGYSNLYPIMLPRNTSIITVTIPNTLSFSTIHNSIQFADSTKEHTYNLSYHGVLAKTNVISFVPYIEGKKFSYDVPDIDDVDSSS